MTLRELINKVNEVLSDNLNKEIINTSSYGYKYDEDNGRKAYDEYRLKYLIRDICDVESIYVNIKKAVNLEFLGIEFKLKRKKSGMQNTYGAGEQMTYSELVINEEYNDKLDIDIVQLEEDYENTLEQEEQKRKLTRENNVNNFIKKLSEYGLTVNQFKELDNDFSALTWIEKGMLNDE